MIGCDSISDEGLARAGAPGADGLHRIAPGDVESEAWVVTAFGSPPSSMMDRAAQDRFVQTLGTILTRASCTALSRSASC
jgi:hypothetical protein